MSDFWKQQKQLHKELIKDSSQKKYHDLGLETYKKLNESAYKKYGDEIIDDDLKLITQTLNNKVYQDRRDGQFYQAVSGSKTLKDFVNDGLQYLGINDNILHKQRLKESQDVLNRADPVRNRVNLTGHSLGGLITNQLIKNNRDIERSINFNPFIPTYREIYENDKITNIRNKNDFASKIIRDLNRTINLDSSMNPIESHLLKNIVL